MEKGKKNRYEVQPVTKDNKKKIPRPLRVTKEIKIISGAVTNYDVYERVVPVQ